MDIGEYFTQEISLEYRIYFLPLGESVQKTNLLSYLLPMGCKTR